VQRLRRSFVFCVLRVLLFALKFYRSTAVSPRASRDHASAEFREWAMHGSLEQVFFLCFLILCASVEAFVHQEMTGTGSTLCP
jgi:hypothetical protein